VPTHALQQTYYKEKNGTKTDDGEEYDHDTKNGVQDVEKVLVVIIVVNHLVPLAFSIASAIS
jgi:hypothetical protein